VSVDLTAGRTGFDGLAGYAEKRRRMRRIRLLTLQSPSTLIGVTALAHPDFLIELEIAAVIAD
jgi:hypothetical protein